MPIITIVILVDSTQDKTKYTIISAYNDNDNNNDNDNHYSMNSDGMKIIS